MRQTIFKKDLAQKKMLITREFSASLNQVWQAWTDSKILDQWWAPKPWKAKTKTMEFKEGGFWLYSMQGPEGEQSWAKANFKKINPMKSFEVVDSFCDENGVVNNAMPSMTWKTNFEAVGEATLVKIDITFPSPEDLEKIIEMGFQEGFTAAHSNLDELFAKN